MATTSATFNWQALGWGVIAGMRSLAAPAFTSHYLSKVPDADLSGSFLSFLQSDRVANSLKVLAATEIIGDKLPGAPDRTIPPVLLVRLLSGALTGAAWSEHNGQSKELGAVLGGVGALAASYVFCNLRKQLSENTSAPDVVGAFLEDALVISGGIGLAKASLAQSNQ